MPLTLSYSDDITDSIQMKFVYSTVKTFRYILVFMSLMSNINDQNLMVGFEIPE